MIAVTETAKNDRLHMIKYGRNTEPTKHTKNSLERLFMTVLIMKVTLPCTWVSKNVGVSYVQHLTFIVFLELT